MRQAVLGAGEVVACVLQRAREGLSPFAFDIGNEHLHDVVGEELTREELRIVAVVLLALVRCGLVHLRYGSDDAVHAHLPQLPRQMEARDAGFVDRFRSIEGEDPGRHLRRRIAEPLRAHLARDGIQRNGRDGTSVYIESD